MALPRTLPTAFSFPSAFGSNVGPFYVNSAVYIVGLEVVTNNSTDLGVWKSSDPDTTAFTEQDNADRPVLNSTDDTPAMSIAATVVGDIIHIAVASTSVGVNALQYFRFDTSTDQWATTHGAWGTILSSFGGDGDPTYDRCAIRVHTVSTEEWIEIAYNGGQGKVHGTTYERVMLATYDPGAGWTTDQVFDDSGTTSAENYVLFGMASDSANRVYAVINADNSEYGLSVVEAGGTINAWVDTVTIVTPVGSHWGDGGLLGSTMYMGVMPNTDAAGRDTQLSWSPGDSPTDLTNNQVRDTSTLAASPHLKTGFTIDASESDLYTWFVLNDLDIWYDLNDGTDAEADSAVSLSTFDRAHFSPVDYAVGGRNVIGYIYDDNGTKEYNEFSLAASPDDFPVVPHEALQLTAVPIHTF
jgi:hypothetical protein